MNKTLVETVFDLPNEQQTAKIAAYFASCLNRSAVITFSGEIGAGKTTFIRAMLRALGVKSAIKSPTFSLIESYQWGDLQIHHFDLYRIHDAAELEYIGFRDYFLQDSICCIEWPERAGHSFNGVDMNFAFAMNGSGRLLTIRALSTAGEIMLSCLADKP